jgi:predicted AlkP superfamily pyrophosphatase or phosphodiesterase
MKTKNLIATVVASMLLLGGATTTPALHAEQDDRDHDRDDRIRHVLLLSIDGMHAVDYQNCANDGTCPHLAALGDAGVTYTRTSASLPSDSFPGLMALVTGGTPRRWARITMSRTTACSRRR